jgi:hypothetical protein
MGSDNGLYSRFILLIWIVIRCILRLYHLLYLASGCLNANHLTGVVSGITIPLPSLLDTRGDLVSAAELRSAVQKSQTILGVFGPGTGGTLYVPYVFRRGLLHLEVVDDQVTKVGDK